MLVATIQPSSFTSKPSNISRYLTAVTLCLSTFFSSITHAQIQAQTSPQNKTTDIEVIEVSHHQFSSIQTQIIDQADFVDSAQSLSDVINTISGIQILSVGGVGNPVAVSIRGSSSKQVQVYIDGQLLNDGQFGGYDLNQIPTEHIESIEITKNQAISGGSTPIGGVIHIKTYNANETSSKMSAQLGSFGYQELNVIHNQVAKNNHLSVGAHHLASDNDFSYLVPSSTGNANQAVYQPMRNNHFSKQAFFINNHHDWQNQALRINLQYSQQEKGLNSYHRNPIENKASFAVDTLRASLDHQVETNWPAVEQIKFAYNLEDKQEHYFVNQYASQQQVSADYASQKHQLSIQPQLLFPLGNYALTMVPYLNVAEQDFRADTLVNNKATTCTRSFCDSKAKQQQLNIGTKFELTGKKSPLATYLSFNKLTEKNNNIAIKDPSAAKLTSDDQYNTVEAGLQYSQAQFNSQFTFSQGVRTPTLFELFGNRGLIKGNNKLKPETAKTYSLTTQYQLNNAKLTSSVYSQQLEDSIVALYYGEVGVYQNLDQAKLYGLELQLDWQLSKRSAVNLQANVIDSETTKAKVKAYRGKKIPNIYHQQLSLGYQYSFNRHWQLKLTSKADTELYFNRANNSQNLTSAKGNGTPADRITTDINLHWQSGNVSANLALNNLFNHKYQDLTNRPSPGRTLFLKLSLRGL